MLKVDGMIMTEEETKEVDWKIWSETDIHELSDYLPRRYFDRVIAINVFGDTRIRRALKETFNILKPGGQLLATFYDRDTADKFWKEFHGRYYLTSEEENEERAVWLTPPNWYKGTEDIEPAKIYLKDLNQTIAFLRAQIMVKIETIRKLTKRIGFTNRHVSGFSSNCLTVKNADLGNHWHATLLYPENMVMKWWGDKLTAYQLKYIKEHKGYPESFAVILKRHD